MSCQWPFSQISHKPTLEHDWQPYEHSYRNTRDQCSIFGSSVRDLIAECRKLKSDHYRPILGCPENFKNFRKIQILSEILIFFEIFEKVNIFWTWIVFFLKFCTLDRARWGSYRYPLHALSSSKEGPWTLLSIALLGARIGHRLVHYPIAKICQKIACPHRNRSGN